MMIAITTGLMPSGEGREMGDSLLKTKRKRETLQKSLTLLKHVGLTTQ